MKKMFIASCIMAAAVFAAPAAKAPAAAPATAAPAKTAEPAAAPAKTEAKAEQPKADAKAAAPAKTEAKAEQPKADAKAAEPAKAEAKPAAEAKAEQPKADAKAEETKAAEAPKAEAKAEQPKEEAKAEEVKPAEAPKAEAKAEQPKEEAKAEEVKAEEAAPAAEVAAAEPAKKPAKKKKRKKKKMIQNAVMSVNQINFDINADFELEAGKVLWSSEDDEMGDNFETWKGEANFAVLAEADDFKGKIGVAFYPADLRSDDNLDKTTKKAELREGTRQYGDDYYSLDEAWAMQETDLFTFKVGRWDNTDKSGDYFGGYIDGYLAGFLSTQPSENQLMFGFTPSDNMSGFISLISKSENLNKGDLRAAFNFHNLAGISALKVQLAYRSNMFDVVYDSKADIKHNASLKANLPIVSNTVDIFAEAALMDMADDLVIPVTGGIAIYTPVVDRILVEAEYVGDRHEHRDFWGMSKKPNHIKDVLAALYLEKAFTSRFSLSAGFHSYGCTKDYTISGNLVGRIN
ncbi:hypothetical protein B7988_05995 [Fibrobacter sp. UWB1]|uniref:hypothetical protein n=1 Tax=unclassified Fibrobacter TaxID=2634177 RepID=UPI00091DD911|nr:MULTISPECIES: hypothetical protein [unclassified Fibrobacter]OWV26411.1 hypothetical protein B7988_05995 [Fibrobacter sp. UWB1]SHL25090.1 hypothetical protein SAMN05720470_10687 [Fibrobacter sp. UWOV1]